MQGVPYGSIDLHGNSMQTHAPNSEKHVSSNSQMSVTSKISGPTEPDEFPGFQFMEHGKHDKPNHHHNHHSKNVMSDDEEHDVTQDVNDTPSGNGKKWTDSMVKLLITAMSYTGDDHGADIGGGKRNFTIMQKKGKWKVISKVMGDRDCHMSPQQCEDKFNDLNKRYKRLIDILGRGTACNVVENPALIDSMNHLSDEMKDDARKIINSKHLFFEEMYSYHNNNRVKLPEDYELQQSLLFALSCEEGNDPREDAIIDAYEDDQQSDGSNYEESDEDQHPMPTNMRDPSMLKRADRGDASLMIPCACQRKQRSNPHDITVDINKAFPHGTNHALLKENLALPTLEIQKRLLQIEENYLKLKKWHLNWMEYCMKKDNKIERMEMENEYVIMKNKFLELELKHKELELEIKLKGLENHA